MSGIGWKWPTEVLQEAPCVSNRLTTKNVNARQNDERRSEECPPIRYITEHQNSKGDCSNDLRIGERRQDRGGNNRGCTYQQELPEAKEHAGQSHQRPILSARRLLPKEGQRRSGDEQTDADRPCQGYDGLVAAADQSCENLIEGEEQRCPQREGSCNQGRSQRSSFGHARGVVIIRTTGTANAYLAQMTCTTGYCPTESLPRPSMAPKRVTPEMRRDIPRDLAMRFVESSGNLTHHVSRSGTAVDRGCRRKDQWQTQRRLAMQYCGHPIAK